MAEVQGFGFRSKASGFRVTVNGLGLGFRDKVLGFRAVVLMTTCLFAENLWKICALGVMLLGSRTLNPKPYSPKP